MIVIYWLGAYEVPYCKILEETELTQAVKFCEQLRKNGFYHVTMSTEFSGQVGARGVSAVENGLTPDGQTYEWSKRHRGGPPTK